MWIPARGSVCCGSNGQTHMDYKNPVEKRDSMATLQVRERALTSPWTGFYCFSRYITSRMVLIYYAQVHFGWLPFTENKGEDVANYIKEG